MSRTRPRVLLYTAADGLGGAEIMLRYLVAAVSDRVEVHLAGVDGDLLAALAGGGTRHVPVHVVDRSPLARSRLLGRLRPDVVQVNLEMPWAAQGMLAAALASPARVIAVEHFAARTVSLARLAVTRGLHRRLDAHVAVSADAARRVEDFYALGRGSVRVLHDGVPDSGPLRCARAARRRTVVGAVGRLDPVKGHDVLLRAAVAVPEVDVVLVGSGDEDRRLRELVADLGIAGRVRFTGWRDDPAELVSTFDVFCHPARYEGLGMAVVEAMRAGVPVVASRVGGLPEVVGDDAGVLVPPDDPVALAGALRRLAESPELRATLGERGRARMRARFSADAMARSYEELWREVAAAPRSRRLRPSPLTP